MFKLGDSIVQACQLTPAVFTSKCQTARKRPADSDPVHPPAKRSANHRSGCPSDVEPDTSEDKRSKGVDAAHSAEYRRKKKMSSAIFRYFVHADFAQKMDLQVDITETLQQHWKELESSQTVRKFDDLSDALLHGLNEILCGSSNYRPLIPASPSLHVNRSVVITVMSDHMYWIVLQCTWNVFTLENMGVSYDSSKV